MKHSIQVSKEHYAWKYEKDIKRWISYHAQTDNIIKNLKNKKEKILEIGIGTKFLTENLKRMNYNVTTADFDKNLKPDIIADVCKLPIKDNSYHLVCAFEVLEHIPFKNFKKALIEMKRVSKNKIFFSVPYSSFKFHLGFRFFPFTQIKEFEFHIPYFFLKHKFDGEHYWE